MILAAEPAQRDRSFLGLALADDEQQRDLGQAVFAHLVVDLLVAKVGFDANSGRGELRRDFLRIDVGIGHDGRDHRLDRRQPQRELAGMMLDQDADEALERAEDGAVEHQGMMLLAVLADIDRAQALGHLRIELWVPALPSPADGVGQVEFELGPIKGALAWKALWTRGRFSLSAGREDRPRRGSHSSSRADALVRPGRELHLVVGEAEVAVDGVEQRAEGLGLVDQLVVGCRRCGRRPG